MRKKKIRKWFSLHASLLGVIFLILFIVILSNQVQSIVLKSNKTIPLPTIILLLSPTEIPTTFPTPILRQAPHDTQNSNLNVQWGKAIEVAPDQYAFKIAPDTRMATAQEIFDALNNYRSIHGVQTLSWNQNLASYAQSRSDSYWANGQTDIHAGFKQLLSTLDGYRQLGFGSLGENSSYGYQLLGVHVIEWLYAADAAHNNNQLDPTWTDVGIGVTGTATDLVFGGNKL